ncbi:MAG: nucleoside 2-deoxyribosyltransferase [Betaproteobacteria bacterium HGW-Betaproteobacteria-12]|nr:MAG: nucleoside 2-deoxyribosyltransferase [Betaproteobacteria bacterium HGW-Betaproteobacteria-12]
MSMKIYLAGPDVFRPDVLAWAEAVRACLAAAGHQALVPLDNEASTAAGICRANLELIAQADVLLANLNPFRGCEPDSGTCFEVGYALALGKRVIGYLADDRPQRAKLAEYYGADASWRDGRPVDPQGMAIEDFALPVNLMLGVSCTIVEGGLAQALAHLTDQP